MTLNIPQTIFTIFFAIFWGTVSNAWPRWKPFHWSLALREGKTRARLILAFMLLNIVPLCVVGIFLHFLSKADTDSISPGGLPQWMAAAWIGAFPAFAIFGISRMFISVLGMWPERFYMTRDELCSKRLSCAQSSYPLEPSVQSLSLDKARSLAFSDFVVGALHVILPGLVAAYCDVILGWFGPGNTPLP